jgi:hypothetical protein
MAVPGRCDAQPWAKAELAAVMERANGWAEERNKRALGEGAKHLAGGQVEGGALDGVLGELVANAVIGYPELAQVEGSHRGPDLPGKGDVKATRRWADPVLNVNVRSRGRYFVCVALNLDDESRPTGAVVGWAKAELVFREDRLRHPSLWKNGSPFVSVHWNELSPWPLVPRRSDEPVILAALGMLGSEDDRAEALRKMHGVLFEPPKEGPTWD